MADLDAAVAQLEDELGALAARAGAVLGTDIHLMLVERAQARAAWLVAEIADGDQADATALDLLALLWPDDPEPGWWRTPLGLLVAPTAAQEGGPGFTRSAAAVVLGVSAGTIAQLTNRKTLERDADGRVNRRATLTRLLRLASEASP